MSLRISRKVQQGIVVNPVGKKDKPLVMRVVDIVPNSVGLAFDGEGYEIARAEIYKHEDTKSNERSTEE